MSNTPNPFEDLKQHLEQMEGDFQKFFEKGNKAAGTRVRKGMKELRDKAQDIRMQVQRIKNEEL